MVAFRGISGLLQVRHAVKLTIINGRSHKIWWLRFFVLPLHRFSEKGPVTRSDLRYVLNQKRCGACGGRETRVGADVF